MARLGDVCRKASSQIAQKDAAEQAGSYPIYGAGGLIGSVNFYHQEQPYIAVVKDGAGVGRVMRLPAKSSVIGTMQYILPNPNVDVGYLAYAMEHMNLGKYYTGATIPHIYFKDYQQEELPLPALDRQREIAQTLDQLSRVMELRRRQLAKLDELVKARFVEMFGDPGSTLSQYPMYRLQDLAAKISDGVHSKPDYTKTGKPFISVVNINKRKVDFDNCKFVSEEAYQKMVKSTHPERGDVLYTKVGATYGIPAYVDTDRDFCLYVSVCLIKPEHKKINGKFLAISMDMPYVKAQADSRIKGIGVPDLHLNQISEFEILCPPIHIQLQLVGFVEKIEEHKLTIRQSLEQLEQLKKSLMQEYFT